MGPASGLSEFSVIIQSIEQAIRFPVFPPSPVVSVVVCAVTQKCPTIPMDVVVVDPSFETTVPSFVLNRP